MKHSYNTKSKIGQSIIGSSRMNGSREENDFYPTPPSAVLKLLEKEKFQGNIWECACGDGAISKVLKQSGHQVYSTDIIDRGYEHLNGYHDFLNSPVKLTTDNVITNPPYKHATEFILKAKQSSTKKIAMLLKTVFLEGQGRYDMFQDTEFPLKTVYQFSKRLAINKSGEDKWKGGMISYAWYVWAKSYKGKPTIEWLI